MKEKVIIRTLKSSDIQRIIEIDYEATGSFKPDYWCKKLEAYLDGGTEGWIGINPQLCKVAEIDGKVVGFMLGDIRSWEFGATECGWIIIAGVDKNYRGGGIARKLAEDLFKFFKQVGIKKVKTMVEWYDGDLLEFFKAVGFDKGDYVQLERNL